MKYAVILPLLTCVPAVVKALRQDWDGHEDIPAHVTLGTFEADSPVAVISALCSIAAQTRVRSKGTFSDLGDDAIFAYRVTGCSTIASIVGRAAGPTWRLPKSGFHVTIAWGRRFQRTSFQTRKSITITPVPVIDTHCDRAWVFKKDGDHWKKIRSVKLLPTPVRRPPPRLPGPQSSDLA